jgi:hypothetical protein
MKGTAKDRTKAFKTLCVGKTVREVCESVNARHGRNQQNSALQRETSLAGSKTSDRKNSDRKIGLIMAPC